jgi:hypothetical protein
MGRFNLDLNPYGGIYITDGKIDKLKVEKASQEILQKAIKGPMKRNRHGEIVIQLLADNVVVGKLFEDINISLLEIGGFWVTTSGIKVELIFNGKIVGMIWLRD